MENIRVTVKYRMVYLNKYYNNFVLDHISYIYSYISCKENCREPLKLLLLLTTSSFSLPVCEDGWHMLRFYTMRIIRWQRWVYVKQNLFETNSHVKENSAALHFETCSECIWFQSQPLRLDNRTKPFCYFVFILINCAAHFPPSTFE